MVSILASFCSANLLMSSAADDQQLNPLLKLFIGNSVFFTQGHSPPGIPGPDNDWLMWAYKVSHCSWGQLRRPLCSLTWTCNRILGQFLSLINSALHRSPSMYLWTTFSMHCLYYVLNFFFFLGKQFKTLLLSISLEPCVFLFITLNWMQSSIHIHL